MRCCVVCVFEFARCVRVCVGLLRVLCASLFCEVVWFVVGFVMLVRVSVFACLF